MKQAATSAPVSGPAVFFSTFFIVTVMQFYQEEDYKEYAPQQNKNRCQHRVHVWD